MKIGSVNGPGLKNSEKCLINFWASTALALGVLTLSNWSPRCKTLVATRFILSSNWWNKSIECLFLSCNSNISNVCRASSSFSAASNLSHFFCWRSCSICKSLIACKKVSWTITGSKNVFPPSFVLSLTVLQANLSTNSSGSNGSCESIVICSQMICQLNVTLPRNLWIIWYKIKSIKTTRPYNRMIEYSSKKNQND